MSSCKVVFTLAVLGALSAFAINDLDAVIDIYSRNRSSSGASLRVNNERSSTSLARSLAHYTMGIIYDNEARADKAAKEYEAAIRLDPDISYVHTRLAADHFILKDVEKAFAEIKRAKELDPKDAKPGFIAALIYTSLGRFEDAQKEYGEIMRLAPGSIWALSSLADIYVLQEKMAAAAEVYEKLIEREKESDLLYFNLGIIYSRIGKLDKGIEALKSAIVLNPRYIEAYIGLGVMYGMKEDFDAAALNFEKALEIDPENASIYRHLARLFLKAKRYGDALRQCETIVKLDPEDADAYVEWADIHIIEKRPDQAIAVLEKALSLGLKDVDLYLALGYSYALSDKGPRALELYNMALETAPNDPRTHYYLGTYYEKVKDRASAAKQFREAIRLDRDYADAYNYLGYMFAEEGVELDEALELTGKAVALDPESGAFLDSLGWALFKKGRTDEALIYIDKALKFEPGDPVIMDHFEKVKEKLQSETKVKIAK
ncbi:MAG: tetratricopeptide repeat protein [Candidatus Omnitrophota bacterium]